MNKKAKQNEFELRRQLFHMVVGFSLILLLKYKVIDALFLFWVLVIGLILSLLSRKYKVPIIWHMLKFFEREENFKTFPGKGSAFMIAGALLAVKLFPEDVALASIAVLAFGDSISHLFGRYFGKTENPLGNKKKLVEGMLAGIVAAFIAASFFVVWYEALLASIGAMIAEVLELDLNKRPVDDNIIVPLVAGAVISLLRVYF